MGLLFLRAGARRALVISTAIATALAAAATLLAVTPARTPPAYAAAPVKCVTPFTATFGHGPDEGLSLRGRLSIVLTRESPAHSTITGELTHEGDKPAKVAGELRNARLLGLSFDFPSGLRVFATGRSFHPVPPCDDLPIGGRTHGPRPGDTGSWHNALWRQELAHDR